MTKLLITAALTSLIAVPSFAAGTTADEWFLNQAKADNQHQVVKQLTQQQPQVTISTHGISKVKAIVLEPTETDAAKAKR
ncbi:hypothetical protein IV417_15715 [Alphaproteobacteria bacterium KMM 3653]|uniref:Uncharacterized protein n=1 Tax=Harenicola maris TaxID=2841044 RepID=A0AAP2CUL7_9RHOB|nr:hypothetical protein [Harenicola maris]